MNASTLYCLCRKPYKNDEFMIECDICKDWFHGPCVQLKEETADDIEFYHCPRCQITHGPLILKTRRLNQSHSIKLYDNSESKTGSLKFLGELKQRTFPNADSIPLIRTSSFNLTAGYFDEYGFDLPVLIKNKEGLRLKLPPPGFSVSHIETLIGSNTEIDVIDVAMQQNCRMTMSQWVNYYNDIRHREKIYNVISLEFSNTKLADMVCPPSIIHELSWVDKYWPRHQNGANKCNAVPPRPSVQRYCLMSVQDSFTDFHIDFGGTCVWYHIFKGEKIFYLIKPTAANLVLYERWLASSNQSETFFADQVDTCYILPIRQGETILIPTGWIHAVLTPVDSLVFGGNFLTDFNISTQLKVYEIERRLRTQDKFLYPYFESLHWYAAHHFHNLLSDLSERGGQVKERLGVGLKSLLTALKSWSSHRDTYFRHDEPPSCKCVSATSSGLIRELHKKLKITAPYLNKPIRTIKAQTIDIYRLNYRKKVPNCKLIENDYPIRLGLTAGNISEYENQNDINDDEYNDDSVVKVDENTASIQYPPEKHPTTSAIKPAVTITKLPCDNFPNDLNSPSKSITDLLHVSGYDVKTENFSQCGMRDAIQGMLSMSQMPPSSTSAHSNNINCPYTLNIKFNKNHLNMNNVYESNKYNSSQKYYSDDIEEKLNSYYKDNNFVYPSVASSDSEEEGKCSKKIQVDEAWNPSKKSQRRSLSTRSSRNHRNGMTSKNIEKNKHVNLNDSDLFPTSLKYFKSNNRRKYIEEKTWITENTVINKMYHQCLVETIREMHNYSSNSHDNKKKQHIFDEIENGFGADLSDGDYDDVDLSPKKKHTIYSPQKPLRTRKTPTTSKQRLVQKLKLC